MKKLYVSISFVFCLSISHSQGFFQKIYGEGNWDHGASVRQTTDSGYIVAGTGNDYAWLIKTNSAGDTLWTRYYGNMWAGFDCVQQTSDGGYIASGYNPIVANGNKVFLVKTNAHGDTMWTKTYAKPGFSESTFVQQTNDGGYILVGGNGNPGQTTFDVYLIKTDAQGDTIWTKTFGGTANDLGNEVHQTADGGYIMCGFTDSYGSGGSDGYLIKTDANGNLLWSKTFGGIKDDLLYSVKQTTDGGYILAGETSSSGAGYSDSYLIKTDSNGNMTWSKTFGGSSFDLSMSVQQTTDGGYITAGQTASFGTGPNHYYSVYLVKTDALGNSLWAQTFGGGVKKDVQGRSVQQTFDRGYVITGYVFDYALAKDFAKLIKTDTLGNACRTGFYSQKAVACGASGLAIGTHTYYSNGTYTDTLFNTNGCDSIVKTSLTVIPSPAITAYATATNICAGTSIALTASGANTYTWSGGVTNGAGFIPSATTTYTVTGTDSNSCSNTATITIHVNPLPDTTTALSGVTITASQTGATYQWLNCNNGYSPVPYAIHRSFTASANGSYAVAITMNGCQDTSACIVVNSVDIQSFNSPWLNVFPNPARGSFTIQSKGGGSAYILDELGQNVRSFRLQSVYGNSVTVENLGAGIYMVVVFDNNQVMKQKIVVE